ncbi:MAG: sterol desaturase family protein [Myxococcota bacterium]
MTYHWLATLIFFATFVAGMMITRKLVFRVPAFEDMRLQNRAVDGPKLERAAYKQSCKRNVKVGMYTNYVFYLLILPWFVSLDGKSVGLFLLEIFAILALFDFMYYWTHRSFFHGDWKGNPLRKIHALHHQARKPTHMDAQFVHPLETFIGLMLFLWSIPIISLIFGAPVNAFAAVIATLIFSQLNTLNHVWTNLPKTSRLFRAVDYITGVHHAHHVDMSHGNYATLTMVYDKLFGTFEEPVKREAA